MYLTILIIITLISLINIVVIPKANEEKIKKISLFWSLIILLYFNIVIIIFEKKNSFQISTNFKWIEILYKLNWGNLYLSIDGISIFFIWLSILLIPICILISWNSINHLRKEFMICLFTILILLIGVFSILDIIGFYILFEGILIPMFLIIGIWGSREEKVKAAFYFFFYTLVGSILMLISIFKLYSITGTTNYQNLLIVNIPYEIQFWLFLGFFASLSVKIPMIPFHIWLPQAHVEAPVSGSVLLAGILLKLGGYGFIRFGFPIFPIATEYFSPFIILISLIAILYGSFSTFRQNDIKRLIAYSSVAHMGLVTLAIFTHSIEGLISSILMMVGHGLVSSALFMTSSIIYVRYHSRTIRYLRGITISMPIFSIVSFLLILANIGFPPTFNFIAEFLSILASYNYSKLVGIISCIGLILSTTYALYFYNRIYFGNMSKNIKFARDLNQYEFNSFLPLLIPTIILGLFPNTILNYLIYSSTINISL